MNIREACIRYDLELALHRGSIDDDALMQLELNDLMPEQTMMLMEHQWKEDERARADQKP